MDWPLFKAAHTSEPVSGFLFLTGTYCLPQSCLTCRALSVFITTEDERVEAAFQYVMSDPDYKFGNRIRSEGLSLEAKRGIILVYQTLTGKMLITP
jgi:hypothetical protein